jgi:hypothetical protein
MQSTRFALARLACLALCFAATASQAEIIDPFTAAQGPITLGPGEEPTEEQAVVQSSSVLGGFRVATPAVDDEADAGATATLVIGGGTFDCTLNFPSQGNPLNGAGCVTGYDRGDGPVFDLTGSTQFMIDVQSVEGNMIFGISVVDADENLSLFAVQGLQPGPLVVPFNSIIPITFPGADLSLVDNLAFTVVNNEEGLEGRVVLGALSTDGAINAGPVLPTDDEIDPEEIPGTYYDPLRDGEGCQLTRERDGETFILTCYFYAEGEQFWVIGVGQLVNGEITFGELTVTSGAQYGAAFDPSDVVRTNWGSGTMSWEDCNNADLTLTPIVPGYEVVTLTLTRIVPTTCGGGGFQGDSLLWAGALFDPNRDGEGFHLGVEAGELFIMTWYTYLNGQQVWLIGTGLRNGQQIVFSDVVVTSGADFGSQFDPNDVVRTPFGSIVMDVVDCNNFTATVDTELPEFEDIVLNVTKIVAGACP